MVGVLFKGPYITPLIRAMGHQEKIRGMTIEGSSTLITTDTLLAMRMVQVTQTAQVTQYSATCAIKLNSPPLPSVLYSP